MFSSGVGASGDAYCDVRELHYFIHFRKHRDCSSGVDVIVVHRPLSDEAELKGSARVYAMTLLQRIIGTKFWLLLTLSDSCRVQAILVTAIIRTSMRRIRGVALDTAICVADLNHISYVFDE